jgi:opacity protein-like surface antigen
MRTWIRASVFSAVLAGLAAPASAQVVHSLTLGLGVFMPRGMDSRVAGDTLVANLTQPLIPGTDPPSTGSLDFAINDFRSVPLFGEWGIGLGDHFEIAIGSGYQTKKVASRYRDLVNGPEELEIEQDLRLRVIPVTGIARVLFGRMGGFQPYVGGGIAILNFRYSESGEFVDTTTFEVFPATFVAKDTAIGGQLLAGMRLPLGGDIYALTIEGRYQWASGNTGGIDAGFLGDKIDLGGGFINLGFLIRF